jgi:hypothetical protein
VEYTAQDVKEIIAELSKINAKLAAIEEAQRHPSPTCAVHAEQIKDAIRRLSVVEVQQGRQNLIAATLGAIGAALVLAMKYLIGRAA